MNTTHHHFLNDENALGPRKGNLTAKGSGISVAKATLSVSNSLPLSSRAPLSNISNMQQSLPQQPLVTKQLQRLPASNRMAISPEKTEQRASFFQQQNSNVFSQQQNSNVFSQQHKVEQRIKSLMASPGLNKHDINDPQQVAELAAEITEHFRSVEAKYMAAANYMEKQTDISHTMRTILIDWLVDVHHKFKFQPETLYLCINIIDRFLSRKAVARNKLQLVGITSLLIAAKYEEIYVPEVKEFVFISADAYTKDEVLRMERVILASLDFNVTVATCFPFLRRYLKCGLCNAQTQFISFYLCELALMEYESLKYTPSTIASASIYLGNKLNALSEGREHEGWDANLEYYSQKSAAEIKECVNFLSVCAKRVTTSKLTAIFKKYCSKRRGEVAMVVAKVVKNLVIQ